MNITTVSRSVACLLVMLAAVQVAAGRRVRLSQWELSDRRNLNVAEAQAWLEGRLCLSVEGRADRGRGRPFDTALVGGRVFNVYPPLVTFATVALAPVHRALSGRTDLWLPWLHTLLVFWPIPLLGFWLLKRETGDARWAAVLTGGYLCGTALLPILAFAGLGQTWHVNHALSQVGLLLVATDLLGRQRIWPGLVGLCIAGWTRPLTLLYAVPLLWAAHRRGRVGGCVAGLTIIAAPLLVLNQLKFGSPLEFGYRYVYLGREDEGMAQRCSAEGLFSPRFVAMNAYWMNLAPPRIEATSTGVRIEGHSTGTSLWITSPLLLGVFLFARDWWRDPARRALMLGTLPVIGGHLCYHDPGSEQFGYYRFALDYLPVWLAVIAPSCTRGWRREWTVACIAWSTLYFSLIHFGGASVS